MAIPKTDDTIVISFPKNEVAKISPYPTVVNEIVAQYNASKKYQMLSVQQ